jgi:hypothetical protein
MNRGMIFVLAWSAFLGLIFFLLLTNVLIPVEDGLWESLEALVLTTALVLYAWYLHKHRSKLPNGARILASIFALILLVGLGEETKWGINWSIKDSYDLHSFDNYIVHFLLVTFGIVMPIALTMFPLARKGLDDMYIASPHLLFSPWILLTLAFGFPSESREMMLYLLFLGSIISSLLRWQYTT